MLQVNEDSIDYRFFKTLNEDIKLSPNEYGEFDMVFEDKDIVNVTGAESLANAIVILLMTRYGELKNNQLYRNDFGCRVHEVPKDNQIPLNKYKVEKYVEEALKKMRRIKRINFIQVDDIQYGYSVILSVTSLNDEDVTLTMELN